VLDMRGVSRIRQDEVKSSDVFRCDKIYPNFSRPSAKKLVPCDRLM
jgi:hypothetical protein